MSLSYETNILGLLWRTSWQAAILILLVWGVVQLTKSWVEPKWRVLFWALPFVRMVAFITPVCGLSIFGLIGQNTPPTRSDPGSMAASPTGATTNDKLVAEQPNAIDRSVVQGLASPATGVGDDGVHAGRSALGERVAADSPRILLVIWFGGCMFLVLRWAISRSALVRLVRASDPLTQVELNELLGASVAAGNFRKPVRYLVSDSISGPATCGLWNPVIILPRDLIADLTKCQLKHVVLHELQHVRRGDLILMALVRAVTIVHWFNPLVYFVVSQLKREIELAVDAAVVGQLDHVARIQYGQLLVKVATCTVKKLDIAYMAGSKSNLSSRVMSIAQPCPSSWLRSTIALLICAALIVVGITEPAETQDAAVNVSNNQGEFQSSVRGSVVDTANNPITDALVTLLPLFPSDHFGSTKTNAKGDFDTLYVSNALKGEQDVRGFVFKEGYAVAGLSTHYKPTVVVLKKATPIEVVVLNPEGKPVPDVSVCPGVIAFRDVALSAEVAPDLEERLSVKTDAMGRATILSVSATGLRSVKVNSTDWGIQRCAVPRVPFSNGAEASKPIEVRLKGVGVFEGHVVNSEGKPIPNSEILLASTVISQISNYAIASTDQTGRVRLTMPVGRYRVSTRSLAGDEAIVPMVVQVKQGGALKVDLPTQKFAKVRGRHITDQDEPVTDSPVFLQSEDGTANLLAYADASGYYEIKLPAGKWQCSSSASETRAGFLPSKSVSVDVEPSEMSGVEDVIVPTGEIIEGKLVGLDMSQTRMRLITAKAKQGLCWGWYDDAGMFRLTAPRGVTAKDLSEFKVRTVEQPLRVSSTEPLEIQVMNSKQ